MLESHRLTKITFAMSGVFVVVAVVWAIVVASRGGSWWGPIHAFLAGATLSAISGATQMFTITWSAAPAPPRWITVIQRSLLAIGVGLVLVGVPTRQGMLVWLGGGAIVTSLSVLAFVLVGVIRRSLLRRFDLSMRFYLLALACGAVGITLGTLLGSEAVGGASYAGVRLVHLHLNLVGLIGFTIVGTLPTLLATLAHHRAVSGTEARWAWWLCLAAAVLMAAGLVAPSWVVGVGALLAGAAAITVIVGIGLRLGARGWKAGLSYWQVVLGVIWLTAWIVVDGVGIILDMALPPFSGWNAVAVAVGVGQVLVGSLAYLVPVLVGAPIGANLDRMSRMPALPLVAANLTGLSLAADWTGAALAMATLWILDFGRRLATLRRPSRHQSSDTIQIA